MGTRIEILRATKVEVAAAFYFPVPGNMQSAKARKPDATPKGTSLSPQEIDDLREGKLLEVVQSFNIPKDATNNQIRQHLETHWGELQAQELQAYKERYRFTGAVWDDNGNWSL